MRLKGRSFLTDEGWKNKANNEKLDISEGPGKSCLERQIFFCWVRRISLLWEILEVFCVYSTWLCLLKGYFAYFPFSIFNYYKPLKLYMVIYTKLLQLSLLNIYGKLWIIKYLSFRGKAHKSSLKIIWLSNLFFFLFIYFFERDIFFIFFSPFTGAELKNTFAHYIIDALKWSVPKHVITV